MFIIPSTTFCNILKSNCKGFQYVSIRILTEMINILKSVLRGKIRRIYQFVLLLSGRRTSNRTYAKFNSIPADKNGRDLPKPILSELVSARPHYACVSYRECHPNRTLNAESTDM